MNPSAYRGPLARGRSPFGGKGHESPIVDAVGVTWDKAQAEQLFRECGLQPLEMDCGRDLFERDGGPAYFEMASDRGRLEKEPRQAFRVDTTQPVQPSVCMPGLRGPFIGCTAAQQPEVLDHVHIMQRVNTTSPASDEQPLQLQQLQQQQQSKQQQQPQQQQPHQPQQKPGSVNTNSNKGEFYRVG